MTKRQGEIPTSNFSYIKSHAAYLYMVYWDNPKNFNSQDFLLKIMRSHGIHYSEKDFGTEKAAGLLTCRRGKWVVVTNSLHSVAQKRFTIGHELGHYFRHRDSQSSFFDYRFEDDENNALDTLQEQEANLFSSELIVPEDVLQWMLSNNYSFYRMKLQLGVSTASLGWRIVRYLRENLSFSNYHACRVVKQFRELSLQKNKVHSSSLLFEYHGKINSSKHSSG